MQNAGYEWNPDTLELKCISESKKDISTARVGNDEIKVGDWITHKNIEGHKSFFLVTEIQEDFIYVVNRYDCEFVILKSMAKSNEYSKWKITDATAGDMLYNQTQHNVFRFYGDLTKKCIGFDPETDTAVPARYNQLATKLKNETESGFANPGYNVYDKEAIDIAIRIIKNNGNNCAGILDSQRALDWLNSLNEFNPWQLSKEQMEDFKNATNKCAEVLDYMKSLPFSLKN